jgi:kinesin family member 5
MSFFQVYLDAISDLIDASKTNLPVREDASGATFVDGITRLVVRNVEDVLAVIREGIDRRATSLTRMNASSSRSHVFLQLFLESRNAGDSKVLPATTPPLT